MRFTPHHALRALAAAAVLAGGGAASRSTARGRAPAPPPAVVTFENQGLSPAVVYAIGQAGDSYRVGTIAPGRTERLRIPPTLINTGATVNFVARPLETYSLETSGLVAIRPGQ